MLLLDLDPQGDATKHVWATMLDEVASQDPMLLELTVNSLLTDAFSNVHDVIYTNSYGLDVIPAHSILDGTDSSITAPQVRNLLVDIMKELTKVYDDIIIDTRRSGSRLTQSALRVAQRVIMPMQAEFLSLENIDPTIRDIEGIKKLNTDIEIVGILPTMTQSTKVAKAVKQEVREAIVKVEERLKIKVGTYSDKVLPIEIKRSTRRSEASGARRLPIRLYLEALTSGWNPKRKAKEMENMRGYEQLAEMIALNVPMDLYLPENQADYQAFIQGKIA